MGREGHGGRSKRDVLEQYTDGQRVNERLGWGVQGMGLELMKGLKVPGVGDNVVVAFSGNYWPTQGPCGLTKEIETEATQLHEGTGVPSLVR